MNIRSIIKTTAVVSIAATIAGCTKNFEDFNTNKHEATQDQMLTDDNLTGALFQQIERTVILYRDGTGTLDSDYQVTYNLCADIWAGYCAPTLGDGRNNGSFYINDNWCRSMFVNKYSKSMNAWVTLSEIAEESGLTQTAAIADILKVTTMHQVTDYYGAVPYSKVGTSLTPEYDSQESIYRQMLSELDEAISVLSDYHAADPAATVMAKFDIVYGGNVEKWIKFANTLRLRLAMRCSYADESLARTEAEKSINDPIGIITENSDNAVVSGVDHHPIYEINVNFNDADCQIGAALDCYLNGFDDPRKFIYAKPANDGELHGVRNGIPTTNWTPYKNTANNVSAPNATNYDIVWINAAEAYFLRAEYELRWGSASTAKDLYEEGIRKSFEEWGASGADTYMASTNSAASFVDAVDNNNAPDPSDVSIAFSTADDFETNLERIITQKWLAVFPNGCEGWAEYRRTDYPRLIAPVTNNSEGVVDSDLQIRRVPYPISEQSENPSGLAQGISLLGGPDNAGTRLWWDQKPR